MHYQTRSHYAEQAHRISRMPLAKPKRFVRPDGELSVPAGTALLAAGLVLIGLFVIALSPAASTAPAAVSSTERSVEAAALQPSRDR